MGRQWLHAKRLVAGLKKGRTTGKLVREISVAAKMGGADPAMNARLFTAVEKAKKEKKIVMVDIYTDWCGWCKRLDRDTYSDQNVQAKLAKDFVSVKVNPEKSDAGAKLAQQFGVRGFPFIGFVGTDGKLVTQISGYLPAAEFLKKLEQVTAK